MTLGMHFDGVLAAARAGEEWALVALYRDLHPRVLRYLQAQEPSEGEDLASQVWLDVSAGLGRFDGDEDGFRRFTFTIARRRLVDFRRRNGRRRVPVGHLLAEVDVDSDAESEVIDALATREALARVARLPPDQAEVLLLRVVAGLDTNEVASLTGRRPGTVRVLQHRALKALARQLARVGVTV